MFGRIEYAVDAAFCFIEWNRDTANTFGYRRREVIGRPASVILPPVYPRLRTRREAQARRQGFFDGITALRDRDGKPVLLETHTVAHTTPDSIEYVTVAHKLSCKLSRIASSGATFYVAATAIGAYVTEGAPSGYVAVTPTMTPLDDTDDEQLDEYLRQLLSRNIRLARHRAQPFIAQHKLADRLGVDRRVANRWENGHPPRLRTVAKIGALLGQPLAFFLTEHPDCPEDPA